MKNLISIKFLPNPAVSEREKSWIHSEISIGNFKERVRSDISLWSQSDYQESWHLSRGRLRERSGVALFCSSYGKISSDIWIAIPENQDVIVANVNIGTSELDIDRNFITSPKLEGMVHEIFTGHESQWVLRNYYSSVSL